MQRRCIAMDSRISHNGGSSGKYAACIVASILLSFSTNLLNSSVIPTFTLRLPADRDVVYLLSLVSTYAFVAWASRKSPHLLNPRLFAIASAACMTVGSALFIAMGQAESLLRVPMDIAFALLLVGRALVAVGYLVALCELRDLRAAIVCVTLPYVTNQVLAPLVSPLSWQGLTILATITSFIVLGLALPALADNICRLQGHSSIDDLVLRQPSSFVSSLSLVFVNMLVFRVTSGFALSWNLESETGIPINTWVVAPFALIVGAAMLVHSGRTEPTGEPNRAGEGRREDLLLRIASFLIIAGFALALLSLSTNIGLAGTVVIRIGDICTRVLVILSLVALGMRNPLQALFVASYGRLFEAVGITAGTYMGHTVNTYVAAGDISSAATVVTIVLVGFAAYCVFALWRFSYASVIHNTTPVRELVGAWVDNDRDGANVGDTQNLASDDAPAQRAPNAEKPSTIDLLRAGSEAFDERCDEFARSAGLTPRESQILTLLARGRDGRYIAEDLCISYNTVKTHVKRIYTKLDVHSQQELINLVS